VAMCFLGVVKMAHIERRGATVCPPLLLGEGRFYMYPTATPASRFRWNRKAALHVNQSLSAIQTGRGTWTEELLDMVCRGLSL
jgi:hypothetical protein